jgi:TonB family protein
MMNKQKQYFLIFGFLISSFQLFAGTISVTGDTMLPKPKIDMQEFFANNVKYPVKAEELGVVGTVYVKALMMTDGSLDSIQICKGLKNGGAGLNKESLRVVGLISNGSFEPATYNGETVRCWITFPVRYTIDNGRRKKKTKKKSD